MPLLNDLDLQKSNQDDLQKSYKEACNDLQFVSLVKQLKLEEKEAIKITSKLQESIEESKNCKQCKGFFMCRNSYTGHRFCLKKMDKHIYYSYQPCKFQQSVLEKEETLSKKNIRMKDIDTNDKNQLKVIKWMDDFYENFTMNVSKKGLYLHGSFGSGKTYLLTALLNELENNKKASVEIVYFPDALRTLKDDWENFSFQMKHYMKVDVLLLDDIGAEKVTEWGRDEVLGTILQYRMEKEKTTFFTSNLNIQELEQHLSLANNGVDKVKARRIIERIKQLTNDLELISENRRK